MEENTKLFLLSRKYFSRSFHISLTSRHNHFQCIPPHRKRLWRLISHDRHPHSKPIFCMDKIFTSITDTNLFLAISFHGSTLK